MLEQHLSPVSNVLRFNNRDPGIHTYFGFYSYVMPLLMGLKILDHNDTMHPLYCLNKTSRIFILKLLYQGSIDR
ncbi:hypothetical protein D3C85_1835860 [compost metagenome]